MSFDVAMGWEFWEMGFRELKMNVYVDVIVLE